MIHVGRGDHGASVEASEQPHHAILPFARLDDPHSHSVAVHGVDGERFAVRSGVTAASGTNTPLPWPAAAFRRFRTCRASTSIAIENFASMDIARRGSIATFNADTVPANVRPGWAFTVADTAIPGRSAAARLRDEQVELDRRDADDGRHLVPVVTYSPTATGRALTWPLNGATIASATAWPRPPEAA
jgi:hypothetical protein